MSDWKTKAIGWLTVRDRDDTVVIRSDRIESVEPTPDGCVVHLTSGRALSFGCKAATIGDALTGRQ